MLYLLSILHVIIMQLLVLYTVMKYVSYMSHIFQKLDVGVDEISFHCVPNRRMFQTICPALWLRALRFTNCSHSNVVALARALEIDRGIRACVFSNVFFWHITLQ